MKPRKTKPRTLAATRSTNSHSLSSNGAAAKPKTTRKKAASTRSSTKFDSVDDVLADIRKGKLVIVTDDADRENEGDLVMAAQKATAKSINFMARYGRGLICAPITPDRAIQLGLARMVAENREAHGTDFTVSVDAAQGITTGISAADRAKTIKLLADKKSQPADLVQPGHIFPLLAKPGGVLQRAGHTEATVDLARLAGLEPAAVLCEILNEDGTMSRMPDLMKFKRKHGLKICTILDLIEYRRRRERLVELTESLDLPTDHGTFRLRVYRASLDGHHHLALTFGDITKSQKPLLVRVHSENLIADVFSAREPAGRHALHDAMAAIAKEGRGVIVYMRTHGRETDITGQIRSIKSRIEHTEACEPQPRLGFGRNLREYGLGAQILADLGVRRLKLLTSQPKKVVGLAGYGLEIVEQVPMGGKAKS